MTGALLLALVYCLPIERIFYNFSTGVEGMLRNPGWYQMIFDYDASTVDRSTEPLMVKMAATPMPPSNESILQQALRGYTLNNEDVYALHGLRFYEYEWEGKPYTCDSYERYWHGFLVVLKPLMYLFSINDITFLNIAAQLLLMFALLVRLRKRGLSELQIPFVVLWIIGLQAVVMFCIDYSACTYIYLLAVYALISSDRVREKYMYLFLLTGMGTAYMDFLTWPLITLGIPLVVFLYMEEGTLKKQFCKLCVATVSWGAGYAGQWAGKWILASVILKEDIIGDAIAQIGTRSASSNNGEVFSYLDVVLKNMGVFWKKTYFLIFLILFVWLTFRLWKNRKHIAYIRGIPYLTIMIYPFAWYLVTKNHSWLHFWMTWRILLISIFALICGCMACIRPEKGSSEEYGT